MRFYATYYDVSDKHITWNFKNLGEHQVNGWIANRENGWMEYGFSTICLISFIQTNNYC